MGTHVGARENMHTSCDVLVMYLLILDMPSFVVFHVKFIQKTADENGITQHIHHGHSVTHASWSSDEACWTITATQKHKDSVGIQMHVQFSVA